MTPTDTVRHLAAAMPALRLNKAFLDWRSVQRHLLAMAIDCPGHPLTFPAESAWPVGADWLRVRVDHSVAPEALASLPTGGGRVVALQRAYLSAIATCMPLPESRTTVLPVELLPDLIRFEVVHDVRELALPKLSRITVRMAVPADGPVKNDGGVLSMAPELAEAIVRLGDAPAAGAVALSALGTLESATVGTLGPARPGPSGPWVSAVLTRVAPDLRSSRVDDPLEGDIVLPAPGRPERMSRIRKWAVPAPDRSAATAWLKSLGSRNLVYPYRAPKPPESP